eukprot:COSAG06_NODE_32570_length_503_cov_8.750000_1_plen_88_part_01
MLQVRGGLGEPVALEGCCPVSLTTGTPTNQTVVQGSDLHMVWQRKPHPLFSIFFLLTPPSPKTRPILGRGRRGAFSAFRLCARHVTLV